MTDLAQRIAEKIAEQLKPFNCFGGGPDVADLAALISAELATQWQPIATVERLREFGNECYAAGYHKQSNPTSLPRFAKDCADLLPAPPSSPATGGEG